jgi:hypothetical protein
MSLKRRIKDEKYQFLKKKRRVTELSEKIVEGAGIGLLLVKFCLRKMPLK